MSRRDRPDPAALRAKIAAMRADLRARRARRREEPRRRWLLPLLLLIVMLVAAALCCCGEPPPPPVEPPPVPVEVPVGVPAPGPPPAPAPPRPGRIGRIDRSEFENDGPQELPWVAAFRVQVAARSPRLAACFEGTERPGALKWTAAVEPESGRVSDQQIETTSDTEPLTGQQRACVLGVLSDPPYRLEAGDARSTPTRVSVAIEF